MIELRCLVPSYALLALHARPYTHTPTQIMLFCKGADNVMFERADPNIEGQAAYIEILNRDLYDFACMGLRTLVMVRFVFALANDDDSRPPSQANQPTQPSPRQHSTNQPLSARRLTQTHIHSYRLCRSYARGLGIMCSTKSTDTHPHTAQPLMFSVWSASGNFPTLVRQQ